MIRDAIFNAMAVASGAVASAVVVVLLARGLPPAEVGVYSLLTWIVSLAVGLATAGAPAAISRYVAEVSGDPRMVTTLLRRALGQIRRAAVVFALLAVLVTAAATRNWLVAICGAGAVIPSAIVVAYVSAYRGQGRFRDLSVRQGVIAAINVTLVAAVLWWGWGLPGIAMIIFLQPVVALGLYRINFSPMTAPTAADSLWGRFLRLRRDLLVLGVIDLIVWQRSELLFLRLFHPLEEAAIYNLPFTLVGALMLLPGSVTGILLPRMAGTRVAWAHRAEVYADGIRYLAAVTLPIAVGAVLFAKQVILLLLGPTYQASVLPFAVLTVTTAIALIFSAGSAVLIAEEAAGFMVRWGVVAAVINVVLDLVLIPGLGALGAAIANGTAQLFAIFVTLAHLIRVRHVMVPWRSLLRFAVAALGAGAATRLIWHGVRHDGVVGLGAAWALGLLIYVTVLVASRGVGVKSPSPPLQIR